MSAPALAITTSWDDGHPLDMRVAELLANYGLPGTFYVPLQAERRVLDTEQIRDLSSSFEVGAHTVHHTPLTGLSPDLAKEEITRSRHVLEQITGRECLMFCFPQGKFNRAHIPMLRKAGFAAARTVEMMSIEAPLAMDGLLLMPTTVQVFSHRAPALVRNLAKRVAARNLCHWLVHCRRFDWLAVVESFLQLAKCRGGVFHLWGHSWEVDEHNQWDRLEEALRLLAEQRGYARFLTNSQVCRDVQPVRL
jgi:peptidoglycan-N-acetylglucosamine deacetylase